MTVTTPGAMKLPMTAMFADWLMVEAKSILNLQESIKFRNRKPFAGLAFLSPLLTPIIPQKTHSCQDSWREESLFPDSYLQK